MFTETGMPTGYDQTSPFTDRAKPPGQQGQPLGQPPSPNTGVVGKGFPTDPTLAGFRNPQQRSLGAPHFAPQPPTASPLSTAIGGASSIATGGLGPKPPEPPPNLFGGDAPWSERGTAYHNPGMTIDQGGMQPLPPAPQHPGGRPMPPPAQSPLQQAIAPPTAHKQGWAGFDELFPGETLTPQMLTDHKAELEAMGFHLRPNAQGVVGKIQYGNEPIADVIQGAGSGLNKKQRLYGAPAGADKAKQPNFQTGSSPLLEAIMQSLQNANY